MAMASVVLVAAAVVAAVLPALRAAAIEPTKVLRGE
jgi:ABC-type lipoprotein release transport system permease subunit